MRNSFLSNRSRATLVAGALLASALLGSNAAQADVYCKPWHIELSAQFSNIETDQNGHLTYAEAIGSGRSSPAGAISVLGYNYFSPPACGVVVVDGNAIFTTDKRDQIFVNFDGAVIDQATGVGTGTYVITGGTGRFVGATGSASFSSRPAGINEFTAIADGEICY